MVLLSVISLGPLLTLGLVYVNRAMDRGKKSESGHFAQRTQIAAGSFGDFFEQLETDLRGIAQRFPSEALSPEKVSARLAETNGLLPSLLDEWRDAPFQSLEGGNFKTFFLALPDGRLYFSHRWRHVAGPIDLSQQSWFDSVRTSGGVVAGHVFTEDGESRAPSVIALMPIITRGVHQGFVGGLVKPARVQALTDNMLKGNAALQEGGSLVLVGPSAAIVSQSGEHEGEAGRRMPSDLDLHHSSRLAEIERAGTQFLVSKEPVGESGWHVHARAPSDYVYRYVHNLIRVSIVVTLLTFLMVILLADYLSRLLIRPIKELRRGAEMIGAGALEYRIELDSHGQDELGMLAHAFNQMGENLVLNQKQIRAYSRSLETANEELDAMVYAISNDLRKSLRGIEAYTNFLKEDYGVVLGQSGGEMLSTITVNLERINQLSDDLINLVKVERDRNASETFELQAMLMDIREQVLGRHDGEILICGEMPMLQGDRARLTLLFQHLADNALKFNQHSVPCVEISCHNEGVEYRIDFVDNGIGVPDKDTERIFELFSRLNDEDEYEGSGTGLNIARRIVADHRGRIEVSSVQGGGTRFSVYLPRDGGRLTSPGFRIGSDGKIEHVRSTRNI